MTLSEGQSELLVRMFSKRIIGKQYKPIEKIAKMCKWNEIVSTFGGGKLTSEIRYLAGLGLIDNHGKKHVASLTSDGVAYVRDYLRR